MPNSAAAVKVGALVSDGEARVLHKHHETFAFGHRLLMSLGFNL